MRCIRIDFEGYKRLADTGCNVDGDIIAFVGLNEAGKSSLLDALVWLTADDPTPLPVGHMNRSHPVDDDDPVVWAKYELEPDDLALLSDLDFHEMPTHFVLERRKDGTPAFGFTPWPERNPQPFEAARARLASTRKRLDDQFTTLLDPDDEDEGTASDWCAIADAALAAPDDAWTSDTTDAIKHLVEWLEGIPPTGRGRRPRDAKTADQLRTVMDIASTDHPRDTGRKRIRRRVPKFILFNEADRELSTVHPLAEEVARNNLQPALANLLEVADIKVHTLWDFIENGDGSSQESYIETANENLQEFYSQAWNQAKVAVRIKVDARRLEVRLKELGRKGSVTDIEERSDGLRTFIALSAFLAAQHLAVPPILLIDEAETHLHYDAQADLVGVLLKNVNATQVFYTTHSPGCLPTDLGTSIRLLSKDQQHHDSSRLKADFWTNEEPGFAPLLYAMGASAAAFSVCRRAVLSEGAADMVLLPTLIRRATGKTDLDYQIAPGLSNAHAYGMHMEEIAAKVVYLTDGDAGGDKHRKALISAGVREERVFHLPKGLASEDLIQRQQYVDVVNPMLPSDKKVAAQDLADGQPIAKSLQDWGRREGIKTPGHVAVAYAILKQGDAIRLTPTAKRALVKLDEGFNDAFSQRLV
ncbi:AAA family ATPase [Nocardioides sp. Y6]|uniref:AAA family ATPase n=1 Tax=Nocardioides malaquae TaxID=2773426 RepID=A0ABR9RWT9_9ACTN|nr:AAA family ATPase [Nocardioides malaquae]MBE7325998.1 AAA family ATPase [Nocardioides malaquae]